jgi:hypothetical protein
LATNTGHTVNFSGGGLDIDTTTATGFNATGGGTINVTGAGNSINATGAAALIANGVDFGTASVFDTVTSGGGANNISLTNVAGTLNMNGGSLSGSPAGAANHAFLLSGGTGNITYNGGITKTNQGNLVNVSGKTAGNLTLGGTLNGNGSNGILVQNNTGGSTTFSGTTKTLNTGANTAVSLLNNTGHTVNFTGGGLDIDTTTATGFNVTGGGTVTVQGAGNSITSTTGTALNVANTTIGAAGLNFQNIASNGAASGIVLNNTGASGGLTVTGTGAVGTGGTIQNSTGPGISLTNTSAVNLASMNITGGTDDGIRGSSVTGLSLNGVQVTNNGNAAGEAGIDLSNLFGTSTWSGITVSGSAEDNVVIRNSSGTLNALNVTLSTFSNNSSIGNDGFLMEASGTATMTATLTGNTFSANRGDHFQAAAANSGNLNVVFANNTLTGGHATALGQGITISAATGVAFGGYTGRVNYDIDNNTINGSILSAITVNLGTSGAAGTFNGFIRNNRIGTAAVANSGSAQASGIAIDAHGNGTHTSSVTGNIVRQAFDRGISVLANDGNGVLNLTVQSNDLAVGTDPAGSREAFFLNNASTTTNVFGVVDSHTVRLNFGGAGALANTLTHGVGAPDDFRIRQRFDSRIELPGYAGTAFDTAAVVSYIQGRNNGSAGEPGSVTANDSAAVTTDGFFNGTVPLPVTFP